MDATVDLFRTRGYSAREETRELDALLAGFMNYVAGGSNVMKAEQTNSIAITFRSLRASWIRATYHCADTHMAISHPAHRSIVDIGEPIIPHLIRDMLTNETHWFYALNQIVGYSVVKEQHRGKVDLMIGDWVEWARENNKL